jgi:catechol 2,3-dioxygenase-like lactoylglutathione lyase family enzyme
MAVRERSALRGTLLAALALAGCVGHATTPTSPALPVSPSPRGDAATVRYQVGDVDRAVDFYTRLLAFQLEKKTGSVFAVVSHDALRLLLSGPGSSGSRPTPDGRRQQAGGWNRIVLYVDDLDSHIHMLEGAGVRLRTGVEVAPGGRQVLIEDPDGNPIELHETTPVESPAAPRSRRRAPARQP